MVEVSNKKIICEIYYLFHLVFWPDNKDLKTFDNIAIFK